MVKLLLNKIFKKFNMGKINNTATYAIGTPTNSTILVGSESVDGNTKNYKVSDLSQFLNSNTTLSTLTVTGAATFEDTVVFSDANSISASGTISTAGNIVAFGTVAASFLATDAGNAPASASSAGTTGSIVADANYIYVCTATDTWKRAALATW